MHTPDAATCLGALRALAPIDDVAGFATVLAAMRPRALAAGETLLRVGDSGANECLILTGVLRIFVGDAHGREVTLAFHCGPGALAPAISRMDTAGRSRVDCEALLPTCVAEFPAEVLVQCMLRHAEVQRWGDAVLRAELLRRADREWALAALTAGQRLAQFRRQHPQLIGHIAQRHVASYLGITPVSLSRLQARERPVNAQRRG